RLTFAPAPSAFAALLVATLSEVALQAATTQNDLVAASLVAAAAYFLIGSTSAEIALAGLAVGLALGTKLTVVLVAPALVLVAFAARSTRAALAWIGCSAAAFALF